MNLGIDPTAFKARLLLGEPRSPKTSWKPSIEAAPPAPPPSEKPAVVARPHSRLE